MKHRLWSLLASLSLSPYWLYDPVRFLYLGLRFFTFKVGITIVATLWGSCKDEMIIYHT